MSRSGRETILDVREWSEVLPDVRGGVRKPPWCLGVVGSPSRMSGSGQEAFPDVRGWFGGPPECPRVVERPSRMSGSGLVALPDFR